MTPQVICYSLDPETPLLGSGADWGVTARTPPPSERRMQSISLDLEAILAHQMNRPPYLMIDAVTAVVPGQRARGYKDLPADTWFFECHFPGDPTMPGMLQAESLIQMAAMCVLTLPDHKGKIVYLTKMREMIFRRKVLPGDRLDLDTALISWRRGIGHCTGEASVAGTLACRAEFDIVMPDLLQQFHVAPERSVARP